MKYIVGLTGPTGAGKSEFAAAAEARGWQRLDCDSLVHHIYTQDHVLVSRLAEAFGPEVRAPDGTVNRAALATRAFVDAAHTDALNRIVLPRVVLRIEAAIDALRAPLLLLDAPTLFESGLQAKCDVTVAILADPAIRRERILARDALTPEQASLRLSAGRPDGFYRGRADYVIENNGDRAAFLHKAVALLAILEQGD